MTQRRDCTGSEEGRRADRDWLGERFADSEITLSQGCTGQCWDNALAESSFVSIKGELLDLQPRPTPAAARRAVVEYIAWYDGTRLHSTLGYRSPAEYEEDGKIKAGQPQEIVEGTCPVRPDVLH